MPDIFENRYPVIIDFKSRTTCSAKFKQGDTNTSVLEIFLKNNSLEKDITGQIIVFKFLKADGNVVIQTIDEGVSIIDPVKGNFQCVLMTQTLACPGNVDCEVTFKDNLKVLSTLTFKFLVEKSVGDGVLSSNYIGAIDNLVLNITAAEVVRVTAENIRLSSEVTRVNSESTRVVNETDRLASEVTRKSNSETRIAAEIIRITNEGLRVGNETVRLSAEDLRKIAETLRATNETDRQNRFNLLTTAQQQAAEVINARTSTVKAKTFASLSARIEEIETDTSSANYSSELIQNDSIFALGKGKNSVGADIDVSKSVVNGVIKTAIEGNTSDIYVGGVKSDFIGKVSGSNVENGNIGKVGASLSLDSPSVSRSEMNLLLANIIALDGSCGITMTNVDKTIPHQLFSFNLISIYEKRYGVIPSVAQTVASKVAWLKLNMTNLIPKWYGYGSCPSGNKATLSVFASDYGLNNGWAGIGGNILDYIFILGQSLPIVGNSVFSMDKLIQSDGFVHFLASTAMASTTSPTLLVMSGHGLVKYDFIENITRNAIAQIVNVGGIDRVDTNLVPNQVSGDIINKYHLTTSNNISTIGTTTTNVTIVGHGLSTGDIAFNTTHTVSVRKITVIDANNFTLSVSNPNQVSGDKFGFYKFTGQQITEATVIPSTIYTDYVSLDITLKPSYKSVGEDFGGVASKKIEVLSIGKNLIDGKNYSTTNGILLNDKLVEGKTYTISVLNIGSIKVATSSGSIGNDVLNVKDNTTSITFTFNKKSNWKLYLFKPSYIYFTNEYVIVQLEEGTVATPYTPYVEDKRQLVLASPLRRVSPTVADVYKEGQVTRNVSEWFELSGDLSWSVSSPISGGKRAYLTFPLAMPSSIVECIKYNGSELSKTSNISIIDGNFISSEKQYVITMDNLDTGMCASLIPTQAGIKAYFYGYKMCHSDGVSPYQVSEVPYNPVSWAEWTKPSGYLADTTGLEYTSTGANDPMLSNTNCTFKNSTKYGLLLNSLINNMVRPWAMQTNLTGTNVPILASNQVGIIKTIFTTQANIVTNGLQIGLQGGASVSPVGTKLKFKDFRVFELPAGSQIETEFNTLTADQLTAKYMFYGLNPKNWKSVVDGSGQTTVLPVAQAPNYTPYKMLYQKATPTVEILNVEGTDPLEPNGVLPLACFEKGSMIVDGGAIAPIVKYSVPINFRATAMDNNASINAIKTYVLKLDSYATNSLLSLADKELRMKAIQLLTTETTTDLKAKINEIITIWRS